MMSILSQLMKNWYYIDTKLKYMDLKIDIKLRYIDIKIDIKLISIFSQENVKIKSIGAVIFWYLNGINF